MQNWRAFVLNVNNYVFCCIASSTLLLSMEKYVEGKKKRDLFSGLRNIQKEMISHFSSTFSICLVTTGLRSRILISSWPPTARRPSISGNVSWSIHCDSSGCSLTPIDPTHTSLRKKPTLFQTSTLALDLLNTRWQLLSLMFKGILML